MSYIDWEARAKSRRIENKALKKRVKELASSRDLWKSKYIENKEILITTRKKVDSVKKNIQRIMNI
jgi:hypothetical protein